MLVKIKKTKTSIFSLIILVLLILSFFIFKFALEKEKIYSPKITNNQINTDLSPIKIYDKVKDKGYEYGSSFKLCGPTQESKINNNIFCNPSNIRYLGVR